MALPLQVHHRLHPQRSPRHANSPGSSCKPKSSARRTSRHSGNVSSSTTSWDRWRRWSARAPRWSVSSRRMSWIPEW